MLNIVIIICSTIALIKAWYITYYFNKDIPTYKPLTKDKSLGKKILYILSQGTYQLHILILFAYIFKFLNYTNISNKLIKISFTNLFTVVIFFWVFLAKEFPAKYLLTFANLYLHLFVLPLVAYDVFQNNQIFFLLSEIKYPLLYFIIPFVTNIINFKIRGVWLYGLFKMCNPMKDISGYIYSVIVMIISILSYIFTGKIKNIILS